MNFTYNPTSIFFKNILGAVKQSQNLIIKVKSNANQCELCLIKDKNGKMATYNMNKEGGYFTVSLINLEIGLYFYYFKADELIYGRDEFLNATLSNSYFQLSIIKDDYETPNNIKGGIIYQIFPDRFCRVGELNTNFINRVFKKWGELPEYKPNKIGKILNNDFFGGNFKGIESKLKYLYDLGVNLIYLNPINLSYSNHRYDTADYFKIDRLLGTEEDFKNLCKNAKDYGIEIIIDGVYNHTGDDSVYFNKYGHFNSLGAYQSINSPYFNWYIFEDYPTEYKSWWGINTLPTINKKCSEFENFIAGNNGVIDYYMKLGASGVRIDVVDELPSSFVKKIRKAVKRNNENGFIIGEIWEDGTNKIAYDTRKEYFLGEELDSQMNYPLKNAIIDFVNCGNVDCLLKVVLEQINNYPKQALNVLMNILGTHDTPRILNNFSRKDEPKTREEMATQVIDEESVNLGIKKLKVALTLLYTLYGIPCVYYGDETKMLGEKDPFNRKCMDWENIDVNLLDFYKKLGNIRKNNEIFKDSSVEILYSSNGVFSFKRSLENSTIIVAVNVGEYKYTISAQEKLENLITNEINNNFTLNKYNYYILKTME